MYVLLKDYKVLILNIWISNMNHDYISCKKNYAHNVIKNTIKSILCNRYLIILGS